MKYCPHCGREMPESATTCESCSGAAVETAVPIPMSASDPSSDDDVALAEVMDIETPDGEIPDVEIAETDGPEAIADGETPDVEIPDVEFEDLMPPPVVAIAREQRQPAGWGRREWTAVAMAVGGGAVVTFGLLMASGIASPEAASPVDRAPVPAAAATPARPAASGVRWSRANVARWLGNGRRGFAVELLADNNVPIWQRDVRPVLVVRCLSRQPEVFVFTDSAAKIEPRTEDHTVRIAFDDQPESAVRWPDSADHDALFAPDGAAFLHELTGAQTMRFGFTPHNAPAVVATFSVAGLSEHLTAASRDCGGKR
jgi:hypothetical protein